MDNNTEPPIACTLQGGSYRDRLAWIAELALDGLRSHSRKDLVLDLTYTAEVAARVREMVRKEEECCAFLAFELTEAEDRVRLTITAPEKARDVADDLFEQFVPSSVSPRRPVASRLAKGAAGSPERRWEPEGSSSESHALNGPHRSRP